MVGNIPSRAVVAELVEIHKIRLPLLERADFLLIGGGMVNEDMGEKYRKLLLSIAVLA
jgi:hypothetical protein